MSTKKQVWQYKCDFCGKKNYSASAMSRHEKHCTMNPGRECRMCKLGNLSPLPLKELKDMIVDLVVVEKTETIFGFTEQWDEIENIDEVHKSMEKMVQAADNCPACSLAALRQSSTIFHSNFDYTKAVKSFFSELTP